VTWSEPTGYLAGLIVLLAAGVLLPVRFEDREDHILLTIGSAVAGAVLGPRAFVLVWSALVVALPFVWLRALLPTNRETLGSAAAWRSSGWALLSAVAVTVGGVLSMGTYRVVFDGTFPMPIHDLGQLGVACAVGTVAWVGTMAVRVLSVRRFSGALLPRGLDPFESNLIPYLLPLIGGCPLVTASIALYDPVDPWASLFVLWWCLPLYWATVFDLRGRRLGQELRRDALARQRLAAIGEVSARIVHQSRHQVGLMGWSIHRLRNLVGRDDPLSVAAAGAELDALADAKDRLSEMLASELLHERHGGEPGESGGEPADEGRTLAEVVAEVVEQLTDEAARSGVRLAVTVGPDDGASLAAPQLRDVVFNLVDNALDAATGDVQVDIARQHDDDGEHDVVRVIDDGPGLDGTDVDRAFEPFFTTKGDGTGMGLAIADALVGDLGGDLRYERVGDRTVFVVRLPVASATVTVPGTRQA